MQTWTAWKIMMLSSLNCLFCNDSLAFMLYDCSTMNPTKLRLSYWKIKSPRQVFLRWGLWHSVPQRAKDKTCLCLYCLSVWFPPWLLNYSKKKNLKNYLGTIFLLGRWPSRPFGTVQVCSHVVVVFVLHALVCAPRYRCSGVKCVLLQNFNKTETLTVFTYSWVL